MKDIKEKLIEKIISPMQIPKSVEYSIPSNLLWVGNDRTILFDKNWLIDGVQRDNKILDYMNGNRSII